VLADRPDKVGHDFSPATRNLTAWRNAGAAISVIPGGGFRWGRCRWREIERAWQNLSDLADQHSTDAGSSSYATQS
jgi:hypothetical protein